MRLRAEHYAQYLNAQTEVNLRIHSFRLKKDMLRLKRRHEHRQIGKPRLLIEKDAKSIAHYRWYLKDTQAALQRLGVTCDYTEREKTACHFQSKISLISQLIFHIGGYLGGLERFELTIESDEVYLTYSLTDTDSIPPIILMEPAYFTRDEFINFIRPLYIGEWDRNYSATHFDYRVFNHIVWGIEVHYQDQSKEMVFSGINAFPYNFRSFLDFFEAHKKKVYNI